MFSCLQLKFHEARSSPYPSYSKEVHPGRGTGLCEDMQGSVTSSSTVHISAVDVQSNWCENGQGYRETCTNSIAVYSFFHEKNIN